MKIPVNRKLYNRSKGTDYIRITINRKNPVTGKLLTFKIPYGSAASFTSDDKLEFDVVIKNGLLRTVGKPPLQTGHFTLKMKSGS